MTKEYKICKKCVSDTSIQDLKLDKNGICQYCKIHQVMDLTQKYQLVTS